jgi:hypothetical protein
MWSSAKGSGMRSQRMPAPTSVDVPAAGGCANGNSSIDEVGLELEGVVGSERRNGAGGGGRARRRQKFVQRSIVEEYRAAVKR